MISFISSPELWFYFTSLAVDLGIRNSMNPSEKLKPQVEKVAALMKEDGIPFGKMDSDKNKEGANFYGVNSYPTLMWFEDG